MTVAEMRRYYLAGYSLADVGARAGVSGQTVGRALRRAGVEIRGAGGHSSKHPRKPLTRRERSTMVELYYHDGLSMARIAKRMNCSPQAVYLVLKSVGFKTRGPGRSPAWCREHAS